MIVRSFSRILLIAILALTLLPGCALWQKIRPKGRHSAQENAAPKPKLVQSIGTVVLVNEEAGFALIDSGSRPSPTMGTTAQSRSADGTVAELRVTEIRKRPFAVADIVTGVPKKGDEVFQ